MKRLFTLLCFSVTLNLFAQLDYDDRIVVAQQGEGIYSILRRMDMDPEIYLRSFIELNREKLGVDSLLVAGNTYILPEKISVDVKKEISEISVKTEVKLKEGPAVPPAMIKTYPVFGPEYQNVTLISNKLYGAVFYLVSGHGGPDPGALGIYGNYTLSEDEYAYDVTLRLARNLISHGAEVHIVIQDADDGIRDASILPLDKDETALPGEAIPVSQRARLKQRTDEINKLFREHKNPYQRLIAVHVDSRSTGENIDVFFYHHHKSSNGRQLAEAIHQTFKMKYARHQPGRNYHGTVSARSNLYMIKNTLVPIVYIELGNIRNTRDQRRLVISDNRQALANWIMEGAVKDYQTFKNK